MGNILLRSSLLALIAVLLYSDDDPTGATSFSPSASVSLSSPATGAASNVNFTFSLASPDAFQDLLVLFEPAQFGVPADASVPNGAVVGSLNLQVRAGLLNGACNLSVGPAYTLLDATTNTANQIAYAAGAADANGDGLHDAVTSYPDSLARAFPGLTPRARLYGGVSIIGIYTPINIVVFEPGTDVSGFPIDAGLGYPAVAVLRNFGDPQAVMQPEALTDVCSPLLAQGVLNGVAADNPNTAANEAGAAYRTNPAQAGAYNFVAFAVSLRDADSDGIENALDTCPFAANAGNPRAGGSGDSDGDGLDNACDTSGSDSDEDNDGYTNRQDNCPLAANGLASTNQADGDQDWLGDVCDPAPAAATGHRHARCVIATANVGGGGPAIPPDPQSLRPCGPIGPGDSDGDGFTDVTEGHLGTIADYPCGRDGWPADLAGSDNTLNVGDFNSFLFPLRGDGSFNKFGHPVPDPQDASIARWDLLPGSVINIGDLGALNPAVDAPTSRPPLFGGQPAFFANGGLCPFQA